MHIAAHYNSWKKKQVQCRLCPHYCLLKHNETGICGVRVNKEGVLYTENYEIITGFHNDPIEKKPLYHYFPGRKILSVGTIGCNMHCRFCQNYHISQTEYFSDTVKRVMTTDDLVESILNYSDTIGIAYTYNEPTIWFEYILEAAKKIHRANKKNVLVSNGYINSKPLNELMAFTDAFNIDLKAFSNDFYKNQTGASLKPVCDTIGQIASSGKHLEISFLLIPGLNDDLSEFIKMLNFIEEIAGKNTPLHISRYYPTYKSKEAPTPQKTMHKFFEEAKKNLNFVYLGNIPLADGQHTYCPKCKTKLIERTGYHTRILSLNKQGRCMVCDSKILENEN